MKSRAIQAMRQKLATGEAVYGLWVTLDSASITEMGVALWEQAMAAHQKSLPTSR
jgi:hypothetical protein